MKNFKTVKIKYIDSVEKIGNEYFPRYKYKEVGIEFVRQFYDGRSNLVGLHSCSRDLIDFLTILMDEDNICNSDARTIFKFKQYIQEISDSLNKSFSYADSTIRKAFKELELKECLIKLSRGVFQVNPNIYFKGTDAARRRAVKSTKEYFKGLRDREMNLKYKIKDLTDEDILIDEIEAELLATSSMHRKGIEPNCNFGKEIQDEKL